MKARNHLIIASIFALATLFSGAGTAAEPPPRPAQYEVPFSAPQNFIDHARYFEDETEVIQVGSYKIWNFNTPNRGFGNVAVVEGENELVVIDTTAAVEHAAVAAKRLREVTDKPVVALIYTHHHADHINGATAFISRETAGRARRPWPYASWTAGRSGHEAAAEPRVDLARSRNHAGLSRDTHATQQLPAARGGCTPTSASGHVTLASRVHKA
jgi:ribonuclease BN (tRNA processing enzyme)